jgi:hypothetical protein
MAARPLPTNVGHFVDGLNDGSHSNLRVGRDQYRHFRELTAIAMQVQDEALRDRLRAAIEAAAGGTDESFERSQFMWQVGIYMRGGDFALANDVMWTWKAWEDAQKAQANGRRKEPVK